MPTLEQLIEYWKAKLRNRLAGTMSSPDPWIKWTIDYLEKLNEIEKKER